MNATDYPYDNVICDPPGPVARVEVRVKGGSAGVADIPHLIDTGADLTLVPLKAVTFLDATRVEPEAHEVVGFDGSRQRLKAADLELRFAGFLFRGRFLLVDQDTGVIGRDRAGSGLVVCREKVMRATAVVTQ